jgi:hypothetical protein
LQDLRRLLRRLLGVLLQACVAQPAVERHSLVAAVHRIQPFVCFGLAEVKVVAVVVFRSRHYAAAVAGSFQEDQEVGLG